MLDAFTGAIHHRIFMMNEPVTDDPLEASRTSSCTARCCAGQRAPWIAAPPAAKKARARAQALLLDQIFELHPSSRYT
jgi:hypothetical protein